jgi:hypothetical protein
LRHPLLRLLVVGEVLIAEARLAVHHHMLG